MHATWDFDEMAEASQKQRLFHQYLEWCLCNENMHCLIIHSCAGNHHCSTSVQTEAHGLPSAQVTSLTSSQMWLCLFAMYYLLQSSVQGLWKAQHTVNPFVPFTVQINQSALNFFLCFPIQLGARSLDSVPPHLPMSSSRVLLSETSDRQLIATLSLSCSASRYFSSAHF